MSIALLLGGERSPLRPKMIERELKRQWIMGSPYKFFGDVKEFGWSMVQARSKPMDLSYGCLSRVLPLVVQKVGVFGMSFAAVSKTTWLSL